MDPDRNRGFTKFKSVRFAYYCADCRLEVAIDDWPSHYRTKVHRLAIRQRTA